MRPTPSLLRVLLLHNRYRAAGGEERAVADIATLLRSRGHEVSVLERSSVGVSPVRAARGIVGGGVDSDEVAAAVWRFRADVVHAHNLHPLFGWRALAAARAEGARTVLHLHNYRLFCAIGVAYRDGGPCYECQGVNTLPGLVHRCRGSVGEASAYAVGLALQQRRLIANADRLVAVSAAAAEKLVASGAPRGKLVALPNFLPASAFAASSAAAVGRHALVVGRLVPEKGFDTAIAAARSAGVPLVVAGDGPDRARLEGLASGGASGGGSASGSVRFVGRVSDDGLAALRSAAAVVLVPSRWDEPFGYVALEALAAGVPVLASARGALPEVVGAEGVVSGDWAAALGSLWRDPSLRVVRGEAGLARARERFGEDAYYEALMAVYAGA
jgi:glycosyltransferase involved in cell wall biosynthesis